jgi:hypothetical protein
MADILHRISIDADPALIRELVSTKQGIEDWWTGQPAGGTDRLGGRMLIYFGRSDRSAVAVEVTEDSPERVAWRCVEGPSDWVGTEISFRLDATGDGGTTLLFTHGGWRETSDFMAHCSTSWSSYLVSLKSGAEGAGFAPYPAGEISRWS